MLRSTFMSYTSIVLFEPARRTMSAWFLVLKSHYNHCKILGHITVIQMVGKLDTGSYL